MLGRNAAYLFGQAHVLRVDNLGGLSALIGGSAEAMLVALNERSARFKMTRRWQAPREPAVHITLYQAVLKGLILVGAVRLTRQLRALEADRLVSRTEYPNMPPRVEYALTERGETVIPLLMSLKDWAGTKLADQINEIH